MKGGLANKGRCPKCTLKPPCKHYDSIQSLNYALQEATGMMMPSVSGPTGANSATNISSAHSQGGTD